MECQYWIKIRHSKEDETWYVDIPGMSGNMGGDCVTYGNSPNHSREMAREYLEVLLEYSLETGKPIPIQHCVDTSGLEIIKIDPVLAEKLKKESALQSL